MEDFFPIKKNGKTASQIIAEAKASIKSSDSNCQASPSDNASTNGKLNGGRLLSTKRPFTPRNSERSRPLSTSLSFGMHPLVILEESDDDQRINGGSSGSTESNSKRRSTLLQRSNSAHSKLPMLVPAASERPRQQFRPPLGMKKRPQSSNAAGLSRISSSKDNLEGLEGCIHQLQKAQDDSTTAYLLEQIGQAFSRQDLAKHKKDLMTIAARHLSSDNPRILLPLAELLFLLTKEQQGSKTLVILASKLVFKLSKDDSNDSLFLSGRTLDLLLTALGHGCPTKDHETFMYAYGGLKFLTLNASICTYLSETLGFLHLCLLHVKLLCDEDVKDHKATMASKTSTNVSPVMFQVTTCLRHLCNDNQNCQKFLTQLQGLKVLRLIVARFKGDVDVMCNVSRILSVLTASFDQLFDRQNCPSRDIIKALYEILSRHHSRRDIVVRVTFVLGNLAARGEEARLVIGRHPDTTGLLPTLLHQCLTDIFQDCNSLDSSIDNDEAALDFGSTGNGEDTAIKIIRVIANASIEPDTVST